MSADLLAEFGHGSFTPQGRRQVDSRRSTIDIDTLISDLDVNDKTSSFVTHEEPPTFPSRATTTPNRRPDESTALDHISGRSSLKVGKAQKGEDTTVLFDATLENVSDEDADDWGEFEQPETELEENNQAAENESKPSPAYADLLGLDSVNGDQSSIEQAPISGDNVQKDTPLQRTDPSAARSTAPSDEAWEDWTDFVGTPARALSPRSRKSKPRQAAPTTPKPHGLKLDDDQAKGSDLQGDDWDDWGEVVDDPAPNANGGRHHLQTLQAAEQASMARPRSVDVARNAQLGSSIPAAPTPSGAKTADQIRPTNIPPPSVLLELFPRLFEQMQRDVADVKRSAASKAALQILADRTTCNLKVAARLVAGRTLRWKRDSILSQSMRIGPARSGKPGGMKLNTVNKTENVREQQQAVELLNAWRDKAAFFNSFLSSAGRRPVQVVSENIRAITASLAQGALTAPHSCALCGLKRDERLPKIDEAVQDSFGEWWTDHWGHTDCRLFWETNQHLLDQR